MVQSFVYYANATFVFFKTSYTQVDGHLNFVYTWFFENRVSKDKDSFYYLAIKNNKIRPKAD